jgi:chaperonin GroEL
MSRNNLQFDLNKIDEGMNLVHKAVTGTMGAAGKNIMFRDWSSEPVITNDGYTIAEMINPEDEDIRMGADFMKQASRRQNFEAGDGTSTVIALTHAMKEEGKAKVASGTNAMRLKREMNETVEKIIPILRESAKKIETDKELFDVANLSMENPSAAKIVVDAVKTCGINGRVVVHESNSVTTQTEEVKGIEFERGYINQAMVTNAVRLTAELENVHVLVADKDFNLMKQIFPIMEGLKAKDVTELVVICRDMIGEALGNVLANIQAGVFRTVVVQVPGDADLLDDIALLTGAKKVNEVNCPENLTHEHLAYLGKAKRVVVSRDRTVIDSDSGDKDKIKDRIESLKVQLKNETMDFEKTKIKDRLAKLDGKVVYIKVGAPTQQDMKYMKLKFDDAVAATVAARNGGIVVGGGRALYDLSLGKAMTDGEHVVLRACGAPIRRIIENAGKSPSSKGYWIFKTRGVLDTLKKGQAWNSMTEKPVLDFLTEGIIDPVDIEIWALKNAVSTASGYITTFGALIPIIPKKEVQVPLA